MTGRILAIAVFVGLIPSVGFPQALGVGRVPGITHTPLPPSQLYPPVSAPTPPSSPQGGSHQGRGHGFPTVASDGDLFLAGPRTYAPRFDQPQRSRRGRRTYPTPPYAVGGYYVPVAPLPVYEDGRRTRESRVRQVDGYLRLQVTPTTARVLVDSDYVGTVDEIGSRAGGLALEPGLHRVRIEAAGFEAASFEVEIVAGEFVSYVRDLVDRPAPAAPAVAAAPKTFYVIPGCYAGDSLPRADRLPDGCLVANLRTVPPELSRVQPR